MTDPTLEQAACQLETRYPSYTAIRIDQIRFELTTVMDEERRRALTSELAELTADCSIDEMETSLHEAGFGSFGPF